MVQGVCVPYKAGGNIKTDVAILKMAKLLQTGKLCRTREKIKTEKGILCRHLLMGC